MSTRIIRTILTVSLLLGICGAAAYSSAARSVGSVGSLTPTSASTLWVDSMYNSMTLEQRVAQLFVPRLDITDNDAGRSQLKKMVDAGVGGFLLGKGTIEGYADLIQYAQSQARIPLMVTLDGEWGLAMRVSDTPRFPYNISLGAIQDPKLLQDYGTEVARECKALGIQVDFAPVLDVNSNPNNPVIGYRSFGEDPQRVATLGTAFSKGLESGGVMSVAKHFPGHGDTSTDSHKALPTVDHKRNKLDKVDLVPFKSYIDAGMSGIMVGHLAVPALDKSGTPASLSAPISTDLLKKELGFKGLVWTDALAMKGANSKDNNCVRALQAGADVLLGSGSPINDIKAVVHAVESGKISQSVIEERCKKVLSYKYSLGLYVKPKAQSAAQIAKTINSQEAEDVNRRLSAAAITCVWNKSNLLPIRSLEKNKIAVVSIGASAENEFSRTCAKYANVATFGTEGTLSSTQLKALSGYTTVIVGIFSKDDKATKAFSALNKLKNVVPVFFINPLKMSEFASSIKTHSTLVCAYDDTKYLREYAAQAIFGGIKMDGKLPVNINGVASLGTGVDVDKSRLSYTTPANAGFNQNLEGRIDNLVTRAMNNGAVPGCQVLVAKDGQVVIDKAYGVTTKAESGVPVTTDTRYDIASMSKATATLGGIMKAYDEGLLEIDDVVEDYVEAAKGKPAGKIKLRDLLTHESGLPPTMNIYTFMMEDSTYTGSLTSSSRYEPYTIKIQNGLYGHNKARLRADLVSDHPTDTFDTKIGENLYVRYSTIDSIMAKIYRIHPGARTYNYSDLNFCILMAVEEGATEVDHEQWVDLEIFQPIGAYKTCYRAGDTVPLDMIAPTERDNYLRRQTMHGYVHDELASFSGGVQGNAGLFSTAEDIAKYSQMLLYGGIYGGDEVLSPETVKLFTTTTGAGGRRALGFDRKSSSGCPTGTYGHLGFTGTCFWVDPKNNIIFVFLSNRVNPTRDNGAWNKSGIRNALLQEVYNAF